MWTHRKVTAEESLQRFQHLPHLPSLFAIGNEKTENLSATELSELDHLFCKSLTKIRKAKDVEYEPDRHYGFQIIKKYSNALRPKLRKLKLTPRCKAKESLNKTGFVLCCFLFFFFLVILILSLFLVFYVLSVLVFLLPLMCLLFHSQSDCEIGSVKIWPRDVTVHAFLWSKLCTLCQAQF